MTLGKHLHWLGQLFMLLAACACTPFAAAQTVSINSAFEQINLGTFVQLLPESSQPLSIEEVLNTANNQWQTSSTAVPSFGFTPVVYWLRVSLHNTSPHSQSLLLALENPSLDHIEFYQISQQQLIAKLVTGDTYAFNQRARQHRHFLFPVSLNGKEHSDIYLRVRSTSAMQLPIKLYDPAWHLADDQMHLLIQGAFYGLLFAALLYNAIMYVASRHSIYITYILYMLGFSLAHLALSGFGYQYLWSPWPRVNQCALPFWVGFAAIFASILANQLFNFKEHFPLWHKGFVRLSVCGLALLTVSIFVPNLLALQMTVGLTLTICISLVAISGILWRKYYQKDAFIFNLAWLLLLIGIVLFALNRFALISNGPVIESAVQLGAALQIVFLSYLMAQRITKDYKRRYEAEYDARANNLKNFQLERQHAQALELAVQEKTSALHDALLQVSKLNLDLARISITDALTGLHNRRHFDSLLATELKRAARDKHPISLILLDADHFKRVNDSYGHAVGDECLQQLAHIITSALRKPSDYAFRYGGEELAILLTNTDIEGALVVAEKVRITLEATSLKIGAQVLHLTASLGVKSLYPSQNTQTAELFEPADQALYNAKSKGRNCVVAAD